MVEKSANLRVCYGCRGPARGRRENYAYSECGLKNVVLKNVMVYRCAICGTESADIPNMDGLHRLIALRILHKRSLLSGEEIRFLRSLAGLTATKLAEHLCVTKTAVSRWENGAKIGRPMDRAVRLQCGLAVVGEILKERSGAVSPQQVESTLVKLQDFLNQLIDWSPIPNSSVQKGADGYDKLFLDPAQEFAISMLSRTDPEIHQRIQ
jgi:DNA-binding transcriptional regulator YiaG